MDEDKNLDPNKVDDTTSENGHSDDNNDDDSHDETVTLSKKELETLKKKAADFEASIELKRINKLNKNNDTDNKDDLAKKVEELQNEIQSFKSSTFNDRLKNAYKEFIDEHRWADDDSYFDKIKESFNSNGSESKDELLTKLKVAAHATFPTQFEQHLNAKITAEVMSSKPKSNDGAGAGAGNPMYKDDTTITEEQKVANRLAAVYSRYRVNKKK